MTCGPWGPGVVVKECFEEKGARGLRIETRLNGEVVQGDGTDDMIFGVREAVSFLSKGTTLRPGDLVFMGT